MDCKGRLASLEVRRKQANAKATELESIIPESSRGNDAVRHRKGVERPRRSRGEGKSTMAGFRGQASVGAAQVASPPPR
jgi:hypothetical protein